MVSQSAYNKMCHVIEPRKINQTCVRGKANKPKVKLISRHSDYFDVNPAMQRIKAASKQFKNYEYKFEFEYEFEYLHLTVDRYTTCSWFEQRCYSHFQKSDEHKNVCI